MARGIDNHNRRMEILSSFGKPLARRSGSKCELCGAAGVSLEIFEVPPVKAEPDQERCVFLCNICSGSIAAVRKKSTDHWRCLNEKVWSDIPAVKILSVMILREISGRQSWAGELLEDVYLDDDEETWAAAGLS